MPRASLPSPSFPTILHGGEERKHLKERKEDVRLKPHCPAQSCHSVITRPTTQLLLIRNYKLVH